MMEEELQVHGEVSLPSNRFAPPEDETAWRMPRDKPEYIPYIISLMNFFHSPNPKYNKHTEFTRSQLLEINPTVVKRWLSFLAYGKEEYDPAIDAPTFKRANSLKQAKKVAATSCQTSPSG